MALAGGEIGERHFVRAADVGVHLMDLAGESVRRKPFGHRVRIEERTIDFLGVARSTAVKSDRVVLHVYFSSV